MDVFREMANDAGEPLLVFAEVSPTLLGTILLYETDTGITDHNHDIDIRTGLGTVMHHKGVTLSLCVSPFTCFSHNMFGFKQGDFSVSTMYHNVMTGEYDFDHVKNCILIHNLSTM